MNKEKIKNTACNVGKLTVRGLAWVGTSIAVVGGGLLGTLLYTGKSDNKVVQTGIYTIGATGSFLAGYAACKAVDKVLVEDFYLGVKNLDDC